MPALARSALVVGTGLMGTSFALALKRRGLVGLVAGCEPHAEARAQAEDRGAFQFIEADLEKALRSTGEIVILAAPPRAVREMLPTVAAHGAAGRLVIDLASTKHAIVEAAEKAFADTPSAFVGGHPMCGAPAGGPRAAHAELYEGAPFALCPSSVSPKDALARAHDLVTRLGARPLVIDAAAHDKAVAWSSHLPHVGAAAVALASGEAPDPELVAQLVGPGFRSTTRVSAGGRRLWTQVLLENRTEVLAATHALKVAVASLEDALAKGDEEALGGVLELARHFRARVAGESDAQVAFNASGRLPGPVDAGGAVR